MRALRARRDLSWLESHKFLNMFPTPPKVLCLPSPENSHCGPMSQCLAACLSTIPWLLAVASAPWWTGAPSPGSQSSSQYQAWVLLHTWGSIKWWLAPGLGSWRCRGFLSISYAGSHSPKCLLPNIPPTTGHLIGISHLWCDDHKESPAHLLSRVTDTTAPGQWHHPELQTVILSK